MTQNEKFQIQRRNTLRNLWQKLSGTPDFPVKLVLAALYLMGAAYVCVKQAAWRTLAGNIPLLSPLLKAAMEHALLAYLLAGAAALLAEAVKKKTPVCYEDLGPEAICRLEVENFYAIVGIDSRGKTIIR